MKLLSEISLLPKLNWFVFFLCEYRLNMTFLVTSWQEDLRAQENIERQQLKYLSGDFERTKQALETGWVRLTCSAPKILIFSQGEKTWIH
jgi:hypothetical protein